MSKAVLIDKMHSLLDEKINNINITISSIKESRDSDTKSSAGDKYETGRAMAQIELDNTKRQLNVTQNLKNELNRVSLEKVFQIAGFGSLVKTNQATYFISIGLGEIKVNEETYYCISSVSPIGQVLLGKKAGDEVNFRTQNITILEIN